MVKSLFQRNPQKVHTWKNKEHGKVFDLGYYELQRRPPPCCPRPRRTWCCNDQSCSRDVPSLSYYYKVWLWKLYWTKILCFRIVQQHFLQFDSVKLTPESREMRNEKKKLSNFLKWAYIIFFSWYHFHENFRVFVK